MAFQKSVTLVVLLNLCVVLCASLPWTYKQTGGTGTLYDKVFSSDERSIQDFYGQYPRSRNELTGPLLSQSEPQDENTASKFQTEQNLRESEMKRNLLHELLDWEKRRLQKATQSKVANEKRESQRCRPGYFGSCPDGGRVKKMQVMDTEAGPSLRDDNDISMVKNYMGVERALRELERKVPGV